MQYTQVKNTFKFPLSLKKIGNSEYFYFVTYFIRQVYQSKAQLVSLAQHRDFKKGKESGIPTSLKLTLNLEKP